MEVQVPYRMRTGIPSSGLGAVPVAFAEYIARSWTSLLIRGIEQFGARLLPLVHLARRLMFM